MTRRLNWRWSISSSISPHLACMDIYFDNRLFATIVERHNGDYQFWCSDWLGLKGQSYGFYDLPLRDGFIELRLAYAEKLAKEFAGVS